MRKKELGTILGVLFGMVSFLSNAQITGTKVGGSLPPPACIAYDYNPEVFVNGTNVVTPYTPNTGATPYSGSTGNCCTGDAACNAMPFTVCAGTQIQFTDKSLGEYSGTTTDVIVGPAGTVVFVGQFYNFPTPGVYTYDIAEGTVAIGASPTSFNVVTSVAIQVNAVPTPAFTVNPTTVCEGGVVTLTETDGFSGGGSWLQGTTNSYNGIVSAATGSNVSISECEILTTAGNNTIELVEDNGGNQFLYYGDGNHYIGGCAAAVTHDITVNPMQPEFTYTVSCGTNTVNFTNTTSCPSPSDPNYTWQWTMKTSNGNTVISTSPTLSSYTFPSAGTYTVSLDAFSKSGCASTVTDGTTKSLVITTGAPISLVGTVKKSCSGTNSGSAGITVTGGVAPYIFLWSPGGYTSSSISNVAAGSYSVIVTDANGCKATTSMVIGTDVPPAITVTPSLPAICQGSSTSLTASGVSSYTWSPVTGLNASTGSTVVANPSSSTSYTVTSNADSSGCISKKVVTVGVYPVPTVTVTPATAAICSGGSVALSCTGNNIASYSWSPSTGLTCSTCAATTATPTITTVYTLTVYGTDASCITSSESTITVGAPLAPTITTGTVTRLCPSISISLDATAANATSYTWKIGSETANGDFSLDFTGIGGNVNNLLANVSSASVFVDVAAINSCGTGPYAMFHTSSAPASSCTMRRPVSDNNNEEAPVKVFPNPANTSLTVEVQLADGQTDNMCIYNATGQQMHCIELTDNTTNIHVDMPAGIYFYRITDASGNLVKSDKLMIVH